jgi:sterol desaturase/sphingolipid hydroxylase (fatty acid hydroxylase superfamily)
VIEFLFTKVLFWRSALKVTTALPLPWRILKDIAKGYLLREVLSYSIHRFILHDWRSTVQISRLHRDWYHKITHPFPLSATYDHPIPYVLRSWLPTYLPALVFRFHLLTYILYLTLTSIEETFAHSGYSTLPTNFILGGIARRTDNHVLCRGEGNFGNWGLVDWVMGTSIGTEVPEDVMDELTSRDVPEKIAGVKSKARRKLEDVRNGGMNGKGDGLAKRRTRQRSDS